MRESDNFAMTIQVYRTVFVILDRIRDRHKEGRLRVDCAVQMKELLYVIYHKGIERCVLRRF